MALYMKENGAGASGTAAVCTLMQLTAKRLNQAAITPGMQATSSTVRGKTRKDTVHALTRSSTEKLSTALGQKTAALVSLPASAQFELLPITNLLKLGLKDMLLFKPKEKLWLLPKSWLLLKLRPLQKPKLLLKLLIKLSTLS